MPLPSFLQRKPASPSRRGAAPDDGAGPVEAARTRARRRLIGAVVLLAVGVVVFPLVFETQPRPVAVNVPIELPARKDGAGTRPAATKPAPPPSVEAPVEAAAPASAAAAEARADAKPDPKADVKPAPEAKPAPAPAIAESKPAPKPAPVAKAAEPADRGERAKALLDGKPATPAAPGAAKDGRFVVQVGAYTDADALREARQKVERLGLKTYTQVVETDAGKRTRVRIGPFATREEAERTAARIKGAALPAAVLTL